MINVGGIQQIDNELFSGATGLERIYIFACKNLAAIHNFAFVGCPNLE